MPEQFCSRCNAPMLADRGAVNDEKKNWRDALHVWHVWINRRQEERRAKGEAHEHSLYEFKSLLDFLEYGHTQIRQAFEGKLRVLHQQCSHVEPEPIKDNKLSCCLGQEVTTCPILLSLKETYEQERNRECGQLGKFYAGMTDEDMYRLMSRTCAWHIYSRACGIAEGGWHGVDTSEGHLMDVSDRMYWGRVYESLAGGDPDTTEEPKP